MEEAQANDKVEGRVISATGSAQGQTLDGSPPSPNPNAPPPGVGSAVNPQGMSGAGVVQDHGEVVNAPAGPTTLPPTTEPGETASDKVYGEAGRAQGAGEAGEEKEEEQPTTLPAQAHLRQAQVQVSKLYTFLHNAGNVDAIVEGDLRAIWEDLERHIKEII